MKKYFLITICLLVFGLSYGQKLIGNIVDQESNPIFGATISYSNSFGDEGGTISEENGEFILELPRSGEYNITITYIGYNSNKFQQIFNQNQSYNMGRIGLEEGVQLLQSVEVVGRARQDYNSDYSFSASKIAIKNKELPQAITTVTKELLADRQAFQLGEAIKTVSNISATGLYNHYNIRGITQADDGQVLNGMRTRQYYFLQPITSHLERVEVIKKRSNLNFFVFHLSNPFFVFVRNFILKKLVYNNKFIDTFLGRVFRK